MSTRRANVKASPHRPTAAAGRAEPIYFADPAKLRAWLRKNHSTASEAWVGLHRKASGTPSVTWPELVDQVLCFGWIDGIRKRVDGDRYMIRITPRKPGSHWSLVNLERARKLLELGLMEDAGHEAYKARDEAASRRYSYEREQATLPPEYEEALRASVGRLVLFRGPATLLSQGRGRVGRDREARRDPPASARYAHPRLGAWVADRPAEAVVASQWRGQLASARSS